jgi:hypothetical protein
LRTPKVESSAKDEPWFTELAVRFDLDAFTRSFNPGPVDAFSIPSPVGDNPGNNP